MAIPENKVFKSFIDDIVEQTRIVNRQRMLMEVGSDAGKLFKDGTGVGAGYRVIGGGATTVDAYVDEKAKLMALWVEYPKASEEENKNLIKEDLSDNTKKLRIKAVDVQTVYDETSSVPIIKAIIVRGTIGPMDGNSPGDYSSLYSSSSVSFP